MEFTTVTSAGLGVYGRVKLAQLFEMPERDVEDRVRKLETDRLFNRLVETGVVTLEPFPNARFATRQCEGSASAAASNQSLPNLQDEGGDLIEVIERVGQENFERYFLQDETLSDCERASHCGISQATARRLRRYVEELMLRAEFDRPEGGVPAAQVYSAVAGIELEGGRPVLSFFHREVWKGRYRIDPERQREFLASLPTLKVNQARRFLWQLEWLDRRKSTLYRVLEALLEMQAEYLTTGNSDRRQPMTQRALASKLAIGPDVLNRLISNKSVRLPWGRETAIKTLVPGAKSMLRDRLYDLALDHPDSRDAHLAQEMNQLYGVKLSRWSVLKYRTELGLGGRGQRFGAMIKSLGTMAAAISLLAVSTFAFAGQFRTGSMNTHSVQPKQLSLFPNSKYVSRPPSNQLRLNLKAGTGVSASRKSEENLTRSLFDNLGDMLEKDPNEHGAAFDNVKQLKLFDHGVPAITQGESMTNTATPRLLKRVKKSGRKTIKDQIIEKLGLQRLPEEGGFYRETYRSRIAVPVPLNISEAPVARTLATAIYYLVTPTDFSALHKVKSDEIFHFYGGDPVEMLQISETGESKTIILGSDVLKGQQPQVVVPAGIWQGTRLLKGGKYGLLGTTVSPGFEFADFELANRSELTAKFPRLAPRIKQFTRK